MSDTPLPVTPEAVSKLTPQQELFCQYYVNNDTLFSNATLAYAEAYDYKLSELSKDKPVTGTNQVTGHPIHGQSPYTKAYNVCAVSASQLLKKPYINARVVELLNQLLRDDVVDAELMRTIKQEKKLDAKINAIKEYNKLKGRIIEKRETKHDFPQSLIELFIQSSNVPNANTSTPGSAGSTN